MGNIEISRHSKNEKLKCVGQSYSIFLPKIQGNKEKNIELSEIFKTVIMIKIGMRNKMRKEKNEETRVLYDTILKKNILKIG